MTIATPAAVAARDPAAGTGPVIAYLALCFIWGSTYLAIRMAVETLPPSIMVGTRSVLVITPASPLGDAVLGKQVGEVVEVETRGGVREYEVLAIA